MEEMNEFIDKLNDEEKGKGIKFLKNYAKDFIDANERIMEELGRGDIRAEIKQKGIRAIIKEKHPENNPHDLGAEPLFKLYMVIYDDMKKKGELK